jgi:hypothetical protein
MTKPTPVMSVQEYNAYLQDNYTERKSTKMYHRASIGKYVVLGQPIGTCETIARSIGCIIIAPLACLCACFMEEQVGKCIFCCAEGMDGYNRVEGFVADTEATEALQNEDCKALGIDGSNLKTSLRTYVETQKEKGNLPIKSSKYPQHSYMSFYGEKSNFSYIIFLPNGKSDDVGFYPVFNKEGKPCNTQEIISMADQISGGWRKGIKTIKAVTEKVPLASTVTNTIYGPMKGQVYLNQTRYESS